MKKIVADAEWKVRLEPRGCQVATDVNWRKTWGRDASRWLVYASTPAGEETVAICSSEAAARHIADLHNGESARIAEMEDEIERLRFDLESTE